VVIVAAAVALGAVAVGLLAARGSAPEPLSPTSTGARGTAGLVEVLGELGASVEIGRPEPEPAAHDGAHPGRPAASDSDGATAAVDSALVVTDDLTGAERQALATAAERGATVVVAAPDSSLAAEVATTMGPPPFAADPAPSCPVAALAGIDEVEADGAAFEASEGATGCFPVPGGSWLLATPTGQGHVVSVGGPEWLTNAALDRGDHAALATALLAARQGADVLIVEPGGQGVAGGGQGVAGLIALVPGWVWAIVAQLGVAAGVLIAWRARRLGRPVSEPQPVALPGSQLVVAVGDLLQVTGAATHAGRRLRSALADELTGRVGLDAAASPQHLAEAVASAGADAEQAHRALAGPLPTDDTELVALSRDVEAVATAVAAGCGHGGAGGAHAVRAGA